MHYIIILQIQQLDFVQLMRSIFRSALCQQRFKIPKRRPEHLWSRDETLTRAKERQFIFVAP